MRIAIFSIAVLMGGWMIVDGLHVLILDRYIGPEKPGPWAGIVAAVGLDPMKFGLVFVVLGIDWITGGIGVLKKLNWGFYLTGMIAVLSLWYFPVGTLVAILVLVLIAARRQESAGNR